MLLFLFLLVRFTIDTRWKRTESSLRNPFVYESALPCNRRLDAIFALLAAGLEDWLCVCDCVSAARFSYSASASVGLLWMMVMLEKWKIKFVRSFFLRICRGAISRNWETRGRERVLEVSLLGGGDSLAHLSALQHSSKRRTDSSFIEGFSGFTSCLFRMREGFNT